MKRGGRPCPPGRIAAVARGELFVLSAPSGAGKTTLIQSLLRGTFGIGSLRFSVSHTTRPARAVEVDGRDYHFVDPPTFRDMVAAGEFLEWAEVHGNLYGTARGEVLPRLAEGLDVVLDIDVQGAEQVFSRLPQAIGVFIVPPSFKDLKIRLEKRGTDGAAEIRRRLSVSHWEIERYRAYRYVIVNEDVVTAGQALAAILLEKRHQRERQEDRVREILADFERSLSQELAEEVDGNPRQVG
jgi:guanylate kinase